MTRETKIGLLIGTVIILVVGALVSQSLSRQSKAPALYNTRNDAGGIDPNPTVVPPNNPPQPQAIPNPPAAQQNNGTLPMIADDTRLLIGGPNPPAEAGAGQTPAPTALTHVVKRGEKARDIAWQYYHDSTQWRLIANANRGKIDTSGNVREGVKLTIPARPTTPVVATGSDRSPAARSIFDEPTTQPADSRPAAAPMSVKVENGDNLSKIAAKHLGSANRWQEILKANSDKLHKATDLRVGMMLKMPATTTAITSVRTAGAPSAPLLTGGTRLVSSGNYTVQNGDTLSSIARKVLGSSSKWSEIYQVNKALIGPNPAAVKVGQVLNLPVAAGKPTTTHDRTSPTTPAVPVPTAVASALEIPTPHSIVP